MKGDTVEVPKWALQAGGWLLAVLLLGFGGMVVDNSMSNRRIEATQAAMLEAITYLKGEVAYLRADKED